MPGTTKQDEHIGRTIAAIFVCSALVVAWFFRAIIGLGVGFVAWVVPIAFGIGRIAIIAAVVGAVFWVIRDRIDAYVEHHATRLDVERLVQGGPEASVAGELPRAQDVRDPVKAA